MHTLGSRAVPIRHRSRSPQRYLPSRIRALLLASPVLLAACGSDGAPAMTAGGSAITAPPPDAAPASFSPNAAVVRYQSPEVDRAVAFYTQHLGFRAALNTPPVFALVSRGDLNLILSGPGSSGARPMPDGREQQPGGWNRIVLYVDSLDATIAASRAAGALFRNEIEAGPGGRQILIEDPDGNPIELHEAPRE